jgi:S-adenosylmethionine hydrolase
MRLYAGDREGVHWIQKREAMNIITLTTDFGTADWFVGSMKGVILGINPQATVVDITHEIAGGDIRAAAFALLASYRCFPQNTIHVAVVDPGVGSSRAAIAVRTKDYIFVGPDDGILSLALAQESVLEIRRLDHSQYFHKPLSHTFHGRDVFAPVAAHLTLGVPPKEMGMELNKYTQLAWPQVSVLDEAVHGEVIYIDHFGNAITNIAAADLARLTHHALEVFLRGEEVCGVKNYYQEVARGEPLAAIGSSGFLEIAINGGHAVRALGLRLGEPVEVHASQSAMK